MSDHPPQHSARPPSAELAQTVSPGELASVLSHLDLGEVLLVSPVALGRPDSPKSLLRTARGLFLVRRLVSSPDLFERIAVSMSVSQRLRDAGLRVPRIIEPPPAAGRPPAPLIPVGQHWFEVREFIPARACDPTPADSARLGEAVARVHAALAGFMPHHPVASWKLQSADSLRARLNPSPTLERPVAANFDRIADLATLAARSLGEFTDLDTNDQLIHGDVHPGNVVFMGGGSGAVEEPVILDVESAQFGPTIADVSSAALHVWLRATPPPPTDNHPGFIPTSPPRSPGFDATAALFSGYHSHRERAFSVPLARAVPWLMIHAAACEIADASVQKHSVPTVQRLVALVRRVLDDILDRATAITTLARGGEAAR